MADERLKRIATFETSPSQKVNQEQGRIITGQTPWSQFLSTVESYGYLAAASWMRAEDHAKTGETLMLPTHVLRGDKFVIYAQAQFDADSNQLLLGTSYIGGLVDLSRRRHSHALLTAQASQVLLPNDDQHPERVAFYISMDKSWGDNLQTIVDNTRLIDPEPLQLYFQSFRETRI